MIASGMPHAAALHQTRVHGTTCTCQNPRSDVCDTAKNHGACGHCCARVMSFVGARTRHSIMQREHLMLLSKSDRGPARPRVLMHTCTDISHLTSIHCLYLQD